MKKYLKWLLICVLFFTISVFLHECGHGLAYACAISRKWYIALRSGISIVVDYGCMFGYYSWNCKKKEG